MTSPDMVALVEWRAKPEITEAAPGSYHGTDRLVVHAVVAGDLLTLCGDHVISQLLAAGVPGPATTVCGRCLDITQQLAGGLLTHIHQEGHQ